MKMEILFEPTSNKLLVDPHGFEGIYKDGHGGGYPRCSTSFSDTLVKHMESVKESIQERAKHKREYDKRMNDIMIQSKKGKIDSSKALNAGLIVTESNETESERHVSSSRSENNILTDDANINSVNDKQPMAEVQLSAEYNILVNEQQHSEQSESIYDTCLLEKVDRNTTPASTYKSHARKLRPNTRITTFPPLASNVAKSVTLPPPRRPRRRPPVVVIVWIDRIVMAVVVVVIVGIDIIVVVYFSDI
ncbi:hypothetical protein Tco_1517960 [Tanacetum coccineum]